MKHILLLLITFPVALFGQSLPFKLHDGYLIVTTCSVGGLHDLVALVDTGVTETTIDTKLVKRLSLSTQTDVATFGTQEGPVEAVSIPHVELGPLRAEVLAGMAMDLGSLTHRLGVRPDVIIGMDMLSRGRFAIDYRTKMIAFGELPAMAHSAAFRFWSGLALIEVSADNLPLRLQVDTGFNAILIYGNRLHSSTLVAFDAESGAFGRNINVRAGIAHQLAVGDWRGKQVTVFASDAEPRDAAFDGLLGPSAIGIHRLAFDFEKLTFSWE
jgi:predicted aspartyl protease